MNDVGKNNSKTGFRNILHFVKNNSHTNVTLITVPHRFDLLDSSCVNNEVHHFNGKLEKTVKLFKFSSFVRTEHIKNNFTRHGRHLNVLGKELISKQTVNHIYSMFHYKQVVHIIMEWKNDQDKIMADINRNIQDDSLVTLNECHKKPLQDVFLITPRIHDSVHDSLCLNRSASATENASNVETNNDQEISDQAKVIRMSNRLTRVPVTKSVDFLW